MALVALVLPGLRRRQHHPHGGHGGATGPARPGRPDRGAAERARPARAGGGRDHRRRRNDDRRGRSGSLRHEPAASPAAWSPRRASRAPRPMQQFCYKTCGPEKTGVKSETCTTAGTYAEMSGCSSTRPGLLLLQDPDGGQHGLPRGRDAAGLERPATVPALHALQQHAAASSAASTSTRPAPPRPAAASARSRTRTARGTWSCASDTAWPCPLRPRAAERGPAGVTETTPTSNPRPRMKQRASRPPACRGSSSAGWLLMLRSAAHNNDDIAA